MENKDTGFSFNGLSLSTKVPGWKRILDLIVIVMFSPLLIPSMLLIAAGIKIISPRGPVFFKQPRIGFWGKPFVCYKFRSMKQHTATACHQDYVKNLVDSEAPMTKLDNLGDPRLIPLGAILRATGLDELPQIFNILRGEMSVVGPRPCTPYEYEHCYKECHKARFATLPGLTGLWQVSGKNETTFTEMIDLDSRYAATQSLGLDLSIMLRTLPVVVSQTRKIFQKRIPNTKPLEQKPIMPSSD